MEQAALLERVIGHLMSSFEGIEDLSELNGAAARTLTDFVLCAAAGANRCTAWLGTDGGGAATLIGQAERTSPAVAAARNGCAAHLMDLDDLHWASLSHPGAYVWPVVLAAGEASRASGADALRAAALGYELTVRLAKALGPEHRRFFHPSTTAGVVGAALSAALLRGADVRQAAWACGHAASVGLGLGEHLVEKSGTGNFHRMFAAQTALLAAQAACGGLGGDRRALEGERGLFAATPGGGSADVLLEHPMPWALQEVSLRYYCTTGWAQAAIEAALEAGEVDPQGLDEVVVGGSAAAFSAAGGMRPATLAQAWWSVPHAVAVALAYGDPRRLNDQAMLADDKVERIVQRMRLEPITDADPARPLMRVTLRYADGSVLEGACDAPRGHPAKPFATGDWLEKAEAMGLGLKRGAIDRLEELAGSLSDYCVADWMLEMSNSLASSSG